MVCYNTVCYNTCLWTTRFSQTFSYLTTLWRMSTYLLSDVLPRKMGQMVYWEPRRRAFALCLYVPNTWYQSYVINIESGRIAAASFDKLFGLFHRNPTAHVNISLRCHISMHTRGVSDKCQSLSIIFFFFFRYRVWIVIRIFLFWFWNF